VADLSVSVQMTLSDLESRDAKGQTFLEDLSNCALTIWPERPICLVGEGVFLRVRYAPFQRSRAQRSTNSWDPYWRRYGLVYSDKVEDGHACF